MMGLWFAIERAFYDFGAGMARAWDRLFHYARSLLLWLLAAIGYGVGWVVGIFVSILLWFVASIIAGYRAARQ